jgi:hypothetical protein
VKSVIVYGSAKDMPFMQPGRDSLGKEAIAYGKNPVGPSQFARTVDVFGRAEQSLIAS